MAKQPVIVINGASVKVMRSYDYCHFEIALSSAGTDPLTADQVDEMRKQAMRLADKAVEQYKVARKVEEEKIYATRMVRQLEREVKDIIDNVPESERTPEQKAQIKAFEDYEFQASFEYDYDDDFDPAEW